MCDEIHLTLAEVRRRTPSAEPAWGPPGTTPRLTVRGTTAGAPPPPPPPHHTTPHHTTPHHTTPHCPGAVGSALPKLHCPLPPGSEAVHCRSSTANCPRAVRQCIAEVALPTTPRQRGSALQELHCPLPPGSEAVRCRSCTAHCPQGGEAVPCRGSTAHCPQAVGQCIAGVPLPTAPRQ